jgi:uncharacterized membrane protein YkoI
MRVRLLAVLVMAAVLGGSLAVPAHAKQDKHGREDRREQREERSDRHDRREDRGDSDRSEQGGSHKGVLGRDEAARRAQRKYGGRVLSVDLMQSEDAPARYRVKLLSDGNVRTVDVDALED